MTTTDLDLRHRVAFANLDNGELRWPELSVMCDCDAGVVHLVNSITRLPVEDQSCTDCRTTGRVPNVTLETMLALVSSCCKVCFIGPPGKVTCWFTPDVREFCETDCTAEAALLETISAWLNELEAAEK